MFRSVLIKALVASAIAIPLIYHKSTTAPPSEDNAQFGVHQFSAGARFQQPPGHPTYGGTVPPESIFQSPVLSPALRVSSSPQLNPASVDHPLSTVFGSSQPQSSSTTNRVAINPATFSNLSSANGFAPDMAAQRPAPPINQPRASISSVSAAEAWSVHPTSLALNAAHSNNSSIGGAVPTHQTAWSNTPNVAGLTPDFGAIETKIYPGTAAGPDLTAQPLSFVPVQDLREVFRFNIDPQWVKQRFERISTVPVETGLHGLRTALVTGTNSWDLHGAQTYYFDDRHRLQRITFRGWVGDPQRLITMATNHFGLQPRPTHWAGLYTGNFGGKVTGGLIMKDPDVIVKSNTQQRVAILMEINQPNGNFELSKDFRGFIGAASPAN